LAAVLLCSGAAQGEILLDEDFEEGDVKQWLVTIAEMGTNLSIAGERR